MDNNWKDSDKLVKRYGFKKIYYREEKKKKFEKIIK